MMKLPQAKFFWNFFLFTMCQNLFLPQHALIISFFIKSEPGFSVVSANDNETARVNEGRRVSSKSPSLARAVEEVMSKETDET